MIRFVDIGKQIGPGDQSENDPWLREFALYDTVRDEFMSFGTNQTWNSWQGLKISIRRTNFAIGIAGQYLTQIKNLCPRWVFDAHSQEEEGFSTCNFCGDEELLEFLDSFGHCPRCVAGIARTKGD